MAKQAWKVMIENISETGTPEREEHIVEYSCIKLTGKVVLTVDGERFETKGKPFGIGMARSELVLVGMSRGVLNIEKSGHAALSVDDATVEEI